MESYTDFSLVYDSLMNDVDYKKKTEYLLKLFKKYGKTPTLLLDLACGTGGFSNQMSLKGIEVIGVDISEDMLGVARENSALLGTDVLFLCQKAEELDLYGTVDGAICCLDSLNHITDKKKLGEALGRVSLFLEEGCLFIFDVNTEFKHQNVLANNTFVFEQDNIYCVWQNEYNEKLKLTNISLDFFVENDLKYERFSEQFSEKAYTVEEIKELLAKAKLEVVALFDDYNENRPCEKSERIIFVTKKLG